MNLTRIIEDEMKEYPVLIKSGKEKRRERRKTKRKAMPKSRNRKKHKKKVLARKKKISDQSNPKYDSSLIIPLLLTNNKK